MNEKVFYLTRIGILCKNTLCATKRIKLLIWTGYHIFFTYSGGINYLPTVKFCPPPGGTDIWCGSWTISEAVGYTNICTTNEASVDYFCEEFQ